MYKRGVARLNPDVIYSNAATAMATLVYIYMYPSRVNTPRVLKSVLLLFMYTYMYMYD